MMNCTNKGCGKNTNPVLDIRDNLVYCGDCGKEISQVSSFMKSQLKSLGQVKKPSRPAYSVRCEKCKQESLPTIDINNVLVCAWCSNILKSIAKPFEILIRKAILEGDKDL